MATCTNPLRTSDCEKPRQTGRVCLRFSKPLASQGLGTSHPEESLNLDVNRHGLLFCNKEPPKEVALLTELNFLVPPILQIVKIALGKFSKELITVVI